MTFAGMNYAAILIAAIGAFVFGGLWYGALSRQWMDAANMKIEDIKPAGGAATFAPYAIAFVALLVMAFVLAGVIGHLGTGQVTLRNGIVSGLFIWAGFVVTTLTVNHTFQMQKRALTLIDAGHWLGVLAIQGAIIGWMGVAGA